jgi:hypothetical protein
MTICRIESALKRTIPKSRAPHHPHTVPPVRTNSMEPSITREPLLHVLNLQISRPWDLPHGSQTVRFPNDFTQSSKYKKPHEPFNIITSFELCTLLLLIKKLEVQVDVSDDHSPPSDYDHGAGDRSSRRRRCSTSIKLQLTVPESWSRAPGGALQQCLADWPSVVMWLLNHKIVGYWRRPLNYHQKFAGFCFHHLVTICRRQIHTRCSRQMAMGMPGRLRAGLLTFAFMYGIMESYLHAVLLLLRNGILFWFSICNSVLHHWSIPISFQIRLPTI